MRLPHPPAEFELAGQIERLDSRDADHTPLTATLERSHADAVRVELARLPRQELIDIGGGPGPAVREVAHHFRVADHALERAAIVIAPWPHGEALGVDDEVERLAHRRII